MSYQLTTMVVLFLLPGVQCWINTHGGVQVAMGCASNGVVYYLNSIFRNGDRLFDIQCRSPPIAGTSNCHKTGYENTFEQLQFMYRCPNNHYIAGIYSYFSRYRKDRRWTYKCCIIPGTKLDRCYETLFLNEYEHEMKYSVPTGKVMTGWGGTFSFPVRDRRYKVEVCVMVRV
ncbi:hypothetical protein V1264_017632 [Littorina saxatilis]|uniref:Uncharacterized protein n=1 Tax=Littorina saxatilis TaxID=31220 RepID=A0AAN9GFD9_9CAEN